MYVLALQVQGAAGPDPAGRTNLASTGLAVEPRQQARPADPDPVLRSPPGGSSSTSSGRSTAPSDSRPRSSTSSGAAASSPKCRRSARTSAESPLVGIFQAGYAELNTQLRQTPQPGSSPGGRRAASNSESLQALDRALLRAAAVEVNKLEQPRAVPRDDGEHHAVHRPVRHGVGHHGGVPGHRPDRLDQPRASSRPASPTRSSRRRRACSPRFRRSTSTTTSRRA